MRKTILLTLSFAGLLAFTGTISAETIVRRFLVAAGSNQGSRERAQLRYAASDAESFGRLMEEMGGVSESDFLMIREPSRKTLQEALDAVREKVSAPHDPSVRNEVVFYYSGHADQKGLLLGSESFPYQNLRAWIDGLQADLRIAILDGCASGAITRIKGGKRRNPFIIDESSNMRGYAFLTSSTANESAQESDRVRGSFFTYYLMAGMRGPADVSGDGKVTLNEAYEFAFNETLARTAKTQGGTQHPAYDMNLVGTGDVVMTDLRQTTAGLILSEELAGRLFIRTENNQLVAELQKPAGRTIEIGLEPGKYILDLRRQPQIASATIELKRDERLILKNSSFQPVPSEPAVLRGEPEAGQQPSPAPQPFLRRSRIELAGTVWPNSGGTVSSATIGVSTVSTGAHNSGGGTLAYWCRLQPKVGLGLVLSGRREQASSQITATGLTTANADMYSLTPAVRYWLFKPAQTMPMNLYLSTGIGPYFRHESESTIAASLAVQDRMRTVFGGFAGGGVDIRLSHRWFFFVDAAYHKIAHFPNAVGTAGDYSGPAISFGFGWQFGSPILIDRK